LCSAQTLSQNLRPLRQGNLMKMLTVENLMHTSSLIRRC